MITPTLQSFTSTRKERMALEGTLSLSFLLFLLPYFFPIFINQPIQVSFSNFENGISQFFSAYIVENNNPNWRHNEPQSNIQLFPFNPNLAEKEDFVKLGLSQKLANTIINFRNKGGKFYKKEDLKKIYGLRTEDYQRLENYIVLDNKKDLIYAESNPQVIGNEVIIELFNFNPNIASKEDFIKLGLSKKVANTIVNFRNKGGKFYKKEDLQKIYGLSQEDFERLTPYILIENEQPKIEEKTAEIEKPFARAKGEKVKIDINQASAEDWQKLIGIGPAFSKRIVKFRNALGGFYKIEQVGETYGLPDSTFQKIKMQLEFSPLLNKININQADYQTLNKHPYISKAQTKAILNYRKQHKRFENEEAFKAFFSRFGDSKHAQLKAYIVY